MKGVERMNKLKRSAPIALMAVPCEDILTHPSRKNVHSFINVVDMLESETFPMRVPRMCFYIRFALYDGGEFKYRVEIWDQSNKLLDTPEQKASLTDVAAHHNAFETCRDFSLPGGGQHWMKVFVNGEESIRVPFQVVMSEKEKGAETGGDARDEKRRRERPARGKSLSGAGDETYLIH